MCTVIFIPTVNGVLLSSCRDENPARAKALPPELTQGATGNILFPADAEKGGTWVGLHENGHVLILLNGAFETHDRLANYVKSRGLVVKGLLDKDDLLKAWHSFDLYGIEPFTLILWQKDELYELVWDGMIRYVIKRNKLVPQIWSSSTLYNSAAKQQRKVWFNNWIEQNFNPSAEDLYQMLIRHNDEENGFLMGRQTVQTLSISVVEINGCGGVFEYYDMAGSNKYTAALTIKTKNETTGCKVADFKD